MSKVLNSVAQSKGGDIAHDRKSAEVFLDFQWKSLTQSVDLLMRGVGFYFVVLLGATGVIYQSKLAGAELQVAVWAVIAISVLVGIIFLVLAWGIVLGLYEIQDTVQNINEELFKKLGFSGYFRRARIVARMVSIACVLSLAVIVGVVFSIQYR